MANQASGELRRLADGGYSARITIEGKRRGEFVLVTCRTEAEAEERKAALARIAIRLRRAGLVSEVERVLEMGAKARAGRAWQAVEGAVDMLCSGSTEEASTSPSFADFAADWTSSRLHERFPDHVNRKKTSYRDDELLRLYINPHVGAVLVRDFGLEHAEIVMAELPKALAPATRRLVAQVMVRLMHLAVYPGRLRTASPIPRGWLPKVKHNSVAKECLFPAEDAQLLRATKVPLLRRMAYAFLCREGMRTDELSRLTWKDVNLDLGRVYLDQNKTDDPRDWELSAGTRAALQIWKDHYCSEATPADRIFVDENNVPLDVDHLARRLRDDLKRAAIDRPQLFERSEHRRPIRAHDLRATFITVSMAVGRTEAWISERTGHRSSGQINRYRRRANSWGAQKFGDFIRMDEAIPELGSAAIAPCIAPFSGAKVPPPITKALIVHGKGLEPPRLSAAEPKSAASAISPPVPVISRGNEFGSYHWICARCDDLPTWSLRSRLVRYHEEAKLEPWHGRRSRNRRRRRTVTGTRVVSRACSGV